LKVFVDGAEISLDDGSTLKEALEACGVMPPEGAIIGIVKGRDEEKKETNSYWLNTTKGKLRIELLDTGIQEAWHQAVGQISGLKVRWSDGAAIAFGPVATKIAPTRKEHDYDRWEVVLGASGFEAGKAQIVFARKRHSAAYGAPAENRGVFASVVGGKDLLNRLEMGDAILDAEPIVEWAALSDKMATQDLSLPLADGMEIYSRIEVDLIEDAPEGAEFFLAATRDGVFVVDGISSSYAEGRGGRHHPDHRTGPGKDLHLQGGPHLRPQPLRGGKGRLRHGPGEARGARHEAGGEGEAREDHADGPPPQGGREDR
jgi:UPF0288 family protein (methanogenesis marker protein 3)